METLVILLSLLMNILVFSLRDRSDLVNSTMYVAIVTLISLVKTKSFLAF